MDKSPDAFRSIGEVSRLVGVAPHVLRYWETQFTQLSPVKRGDGRRYYRPEDVRLVAGLCQVLREEGLSIRGAKRLITGDRGAGLRQIGALRLGESQGNGTGAAVTLALPELADIAPKKISPPRTTPIRRKTTKQISRDESLPLFADRAPLVADQWLARLCGLAAALRRHESRNTALPAQVSALRDALRSAR